MRRIIFLNILALLAVSFLIFGSDFVADQAPTTADTSGPIWEASDSPAANSPAMDSLAIDSLGSDSQAAEPLVQEAGPRELSTYEPEADSSGGLREIANKAFGWGERLVFDISYGPINAGTAVMEVKEIVPLNGRDCYHVISTARSNKFFSAFYKVEDRVESFFDVRGLFTWKFVQHLREGKYRADRYAIYDQVNHTVTTNRGDMDIPPYVQDVLSTMYYVRTQPLEVGQVMFVDNHSGRKMYPLKVKVHRREQVKVPAGSFDCFVVEPMLKAGGLFKHEGRIWVWLTADERKLPVLMKSKVIIGSVDAKLKSYKLGKVS